MLRRTRRTITRYITEPQAGVSISALYYEAKIKMNTNVLQLASNTVNVKQELHARLTAAGRRKWKFLYVNIL